MANLNKVMLIGRLTRDPEIRTFSNGGKVAKFGFAVNNRTKKAASGLMSRFFLIVRLLIVVITANLLTGLNK